MIKRIFATFIGAFMLLAGVAQAETLADINGQWAAKWGNYQMGNITITARNAGKISEVQLEAKNWLTEDNYRCTFISRLDDAGATTEINLVTAWVRKECPTLTGWSFSRDQDTQLTITFANDEVRLKEAGLDVAGLYAQARAPLPSEVDDVVPPVDIIGVTLGMTPEQLNEHLVAKGFEKNGAIYTRGEFTNTINGRKDYEDKITPTWAGVYEGMHYPGAGTLKKVERYSKVDSSKSMHIDVMRDGVRQKYGDPVKVKSATVWAYKHGALDVPISDQKACNPDYERPMAIVGALHVLEACSHTMDIDIRSNSERAVSGIDAWMRDHDTERFEQWTATYLKLAEELEEQAQVFEREMKLEL